MRFSLHSSLGACFSNRNYEKSTSTYVKTIIFVDDWYNFLILTNWGGNNGTNKKVRRLFSTRGRKKGVKQRLLDIITMLLESEKPICWSKTKIHFFEVGPFNWVILVCRKKQHHVMLLLPRSVAKLNKKRWTE